MFYKWGRFAFRHRRIIPLVVIVLILAMQVLFGSKLGERLSQEGWEAVSYTHLRAHET